ncbi:MAG: hypothetical protein EOP00_23650 [Pedobacter sp.]|nr:MAG: hypothetical protein EOP00_23650 [Pedobacter sp.]
MNQIFSKTEKIRFKHVDYAGIVFYPRFLEMLNDLVEDWFEEALDRPFSKIHETNGIPTVDLKVQFKTAARIGELLTKNLWVNELKNSSVVCGFNFNSCHMAKYSEKAGDKVSEAIHEMKEGKLKTGTGKKVTSQKQAVAIGLSEAKKEGAKVPKKKS